MPNRCYLQCQRLVFLPVGHKYVTVLAARSRAFCIKSYGLQPWIDVLDPKIHSDGPSLDQNIKDIISHSFSLLAVV